MVSSKDLRITLPTFSSRFITGVLLICIAGCGNHVSCSEKVNMEVLAVGNNVDVLGRNRNVTCRTNSTAVSLQWVKERGDVNLSNRTHFENHQATLLFRNVTLEDFDNYTCIALQGNKQVLNETYSFEFPVEPKLTVKPVTEVVDGTSINLNCKVRGFPLPEAVYWSYGTMGLSNGSAFTLEIKNQSLIELTLQLTIHNATASNNGTYRCIVGTQTERAQLIVKSSPVVEIDVIKAVGRQQIFVNWTLSNGNSNLKTLVLKYKKSDGALDSANVLSKTQYVLKNLASNALYDSFSLEAVNAIGRHTAKDDRRVKTLETDPKFIPKISVNGITSSSVTLGWNDLQDMADFYHFFNVSVRMLRSGHLNASDYYRTTENPFMVERLRSGTDYLFQVRACSEYTMLCDEFSEQVNGTTMDGRSSAPRNLNLVCHFDASLREGTIIASWDEPGDPQGRIMEYSIVLRGNASFSDGSGRVAEDVIGPINKTVPHHQRKIEFNRQPPNTNLFLSVCAKTRSKTCGDSADAFCSTPTSIPDTDELSKASWKAVQRKNQQIVFMVNLPSISERNGSICCFRLIVVRLKIDESVKDLRPPTELEISTYDEVHNNTNGGAYIAEFLDGNSRKIMIGDDDVAESKRNPCRSCGMSTDGITGSFRKTQFFTFHGGRSHRKRHASSSQIFSFHAKDGPLDADSTYTAYLDAIVMVDDKQFRSQSRYFEPLRPVRMQEPAQTFLPGIAVISSLFVALLVVLATLGCVMRWRRKEPGDQEYQGISTSCQQCFRSLRGQQPIPSDEPPVLPPLTKEELVDAYIKRHQDSDHGFQEEFENLPDRFSDRTTFASDNRDNSTKNRYPDIKAFDQTRVKLQAGEGSDYINANYVIGFKERKKFICAQGPMEATVNDWWRMVWEQRVHLIIMLTNVEEYNKTKCAKYWPSEGSIDYGDLHVTHHDEKRLSDYLVRHLKLSKIRQDSNEQDSGSTEERNITQYHYLVWKDFMAPEHPVGIIRFIKRFNEIYSADLGPILVHCSAGVGRTGTLVALDSLMQQFNEEGEASIFNTICDLRHQRNYLVQSLKQYIFVYRALMEMCQFGDTEIPASDLKASVEKLRVVEEGHEKSRMQEEFEKLSQVIEDRKSFSVGQSDENKHRNRHETVIPYDRTRVILSPMPGLNKEICTYINASFIEGYDNSNSEQFIITQDPLDVTVGDFWRMIVEQNVKGVVMLSEPGEEKCPRYWPEKDQETSHDFIKVKYMQSQSFPFYYRREFTVTNTKIEDSCLVTQFQYNGWPVGDGEVPTIDRGIVELIDTAFKHKETLEKNCGPMVVHCSDGADRSCIFVALAILVQQLMNESRVDVFSVARKLRSQRPGLFKNFAQYEFIYRGLVTYAELHVANGNAGH